MRSDIFGGEAVLNRFSMVLKVLKGTTSNLKRFWNGFGGSWRAKPLQNLKRCWSGSLLFWSGLQEVLKQFSMVLKQFSMVLKRFSYTQDFPAPVVKILRILKDLRFSSKVKISHPQWTLRTRISYYFHPRWNFSSTVTFSNSSKTHPWWIKSHPRWNLTHPQWNWNFTFPQNLIQCEKLTFTPAHLNAQCWHTVYFICKKEEGGEQNRKLYRYIREASQIT